jgi:hypothetical protein
MTPQEKLPGCVMFERLRHEIEQAFRDIPQYGEVSFTVFFRDGEPCRIEYKAATNRLIPPRSERGGR